MAQVPVYGGPQVAQRPLDIPVQRQIDVSSGLNRLGQGVVDVADAGMKIQLRDAQAEADTVDQEITSGWLKWDAENRRKYQGENVGEYETAATQWWSEARSKYGESVKHPYVRQQLGTAIGRKQNQALAGVIAHVGQVKDQHADSAYDAAQQTRIDFGVDSNNPASVSEQIREESAKYGARKGFTTEQVQVEQQKRLGTLHLAYIDKLSQTNAEGAQQYYNEHKDEIPAHVQARAEQVLTAEVDNQWSTKFAASVANKPVEEQLAEAAKIENPQRQEKAIAKIKQNIALVDVAKRQRQEAAGEQAWGSAFNYQQPSERDLANMTPADRRQLEEYTRLRTERLTKGEDVKTDPDVWAGLMQLAIDNPVAFSKVKVDRLTESLSTPQISQLAAMVKDANDPSKQPDVATRTQQLATVTRTMKKEEKSAFESAAFGEWALFQEQHKRMPNFNERQKIIDEMLTERVLDKGFLWDTTKPTWKMEPEEVLRSPPVANQPASRRSSGAVTQPGAAPAAAPAAAPGGGSAQVGTATRRWTPQVTTAAKAKGLDPNVLLAQIEVESSGNPDAVGPMTKYGTAKGLTQFIDSTAAQYGVKVGDPQSQIDGQAAYMGDLMKQYNNDYAKALAAYNWGPGKVDAAGAAWREKMPPETKAYVKSVLTKAGLPGDGETHKKGQVYTDAKGNNAIYLGKGKWMEIPA